MISPDDRNRASLANEDWPGAEAGLDRTDRGLDAGRIDIDQDGRSAVVADDLVSHAGRADLGDVFLELPRDRLGVLVGNQAEAELGAPLAREHGLGSGAGITAEDAVDIARRPGPLPLERGIAGLTLERSYAEIGLKLGFRKRQFGKLGRAPSLRAA